jgi:hypothetical protein
MIEALGEVFRVEKLGKDELVRFELNGAIFPAPSTPTDASPVTLCSKTI